MEFEWDRRKPAATVAGNAARIPGGSQRAAARFQAAHWIKSRSQLSVMAQGIAPWEPEPLGKMRCPDGRCMKQNADSRRVG